MIKSSSVLLHPLPLIAIVDYHIRRGENQSRSIGALLGKISSGRNVVEVEECFAIPLEENESDVSIGSEYLKKVIALSKLSYPDLEVVGWFTTTSEADNNKSTLDNIITTKSCMIHETFSDETPNPIHVIVDTSSKQQRKDIVRAFTISTMELNGKLLAAEFRPVNVELVSSEAERIGVDLVLRSVSGSGAVSMDAIKDVSDIAGLEAVVKKLLGMLEEVSTYVEAVVAGKIPSDHEVGRQIANLIARCPRIKPELFVDSFNKSLHDLLAVIYLSDLIRTQMAIGEKIGSVL